MTAANSIRQAMQNASWIRRMFEAGIALRAEIGAENVFDFSLGNPYLEPPEQFQQALIDLATNPPPGMHRYMPNAGFPSTRKAVADALSAQEQVELEPEDTIITVGAAGGLNASLKAVLDPGDEVIVLAPFFVEYLFYIPNHGGVSKVVETTEDFDLDIDAIAAALSSRTKVVMLNTPNNPTGRIYSQERMAQLGALLAAHEERLGRPIYLLADTPYAQITYDGARNPLLFADHPNTLLVHSHSKDLGLAGERIGYVAINPAAPYRLELRNAITFCNRTLGFVNAPAMMQKAMERSLGATVDMTPYIEARELLCDGLAAAGYEFRKPGGAFYLFPKTPIDDMEFVELLRKQNVLVVPGRGFGRPGHIRICYCVPPSTVKRALPAFVEAFKAATRA
jgi:aspartate aminotransferase